MNGKLSKREFFQVVLTAVLIMVTVVVTAFLLTIVLSGILISHPAQLGDITNWQINHDYCQLQQYLLNPFVPRLSLDYLTISVHGFAHYRQVKILTGILELTGTRSLVLITISLRSIKRSPKLLLNQLRAIWIILVVLIMGMTLFFIDFNNNFIRLHRILFNNNWWIFNPASDQTILLIPVTFFTKCGLIMLTIVVLMGLIAILLVRHQLIITYFGFNKTDYRWNQGHHNDC